MCETPVPTARWVRDLRICCRTFERVPHACISGLALSVWLSDEPAAVPADRVAERIAREYGLHCTASVVQRNLIVRLSRTDRSVK